MQLFIALFGSNVSTFHPAIVKDRMRNTVQSELRKVIESKEACLVLGAGVSKATCPNESAVTWPGLIKNGIEYLSDVDPGGSGRHQAMFDHLSTDLTDPSNFLILGEYIETQINKKGGGFGRWLSSQFENLKIEEKTLVKAIDALNLPIITTNYDGIIEQITLRSRCTLKNVQEFVGELRNANENNRRSVFHIHGYYSEPETIIFGSSSYQRLLKDDFLQNFERSISVFKALVFVGTGSGIADPHFEGLLDWASRNPAITHSVFLLTTDTASPAIPKSVVPVRYGADYANLAGFLSDLHPAQPRNTGPSASIRAFLNQAELDSTRVDLDTGGHAAVALALSPIALDEIEERARHLLLLERSKAYCKINRFSEAIVDAKIVSDYFRNRTLLFHMNAEAVINTVMRDQERWADAVVQAASMTECADTEGGRRAKAIAYHALARSLALAGKTTEALAYAQKTLAHSVTAEERGEAFFAEGEAHRHAKAIDEALIAYSKSENTTFISGKTDLYIWCKLCLADCHFLKGNFSETDKQLRHFSSAIRNRYEDHPLETLHWKLSDAALKWSRMKGSGEAIAVFDVAKQYTEILGITWPTAYLANLQAGKTDPKKL
jgi:tetratricopeptide (TPR) repeat protein